MNPTAAGPVHSLPLVTIAIPTFNRAHLLGEAIRSAASQDYPNIEILVSNNCSTDGTDALLADWSDPRLRVLRHSQNMGLVGNWNACLAEATGAYYLMLNDDDTLVPGAISALVAPFLAADAGTGTRPEDVAFTYGYAEMHDVAKDTRSLSTAAPYRESSASYREQYLRFQRLTYPSATLLRTAEVRALGGYGDGKNCSIDVEAAFKVSGDHPVVICTRTVTTGYIFHPTNFTNSLTVDHAMAYARGVARLAESLARKDGDRIALFRARRAGQWGTASTAGHLIINQAFKGDVGFAASLGRLWHLRGDFANPPGLVVLAKTMLKLLLTVTIGWRRVRNA